ncbi:Crp/Fnr family transcriptional regulator [Chryseobacterium sp. MYb7]|jgi:CRP-like cAMP-binding protein|uniref:Crp/Fnr family transcriptional regulator n=1 Tax=Chryseobacterium sp. MYb7 TaxID=1827290 RepID=UPI000D004D4E|nr:Crp/Fnr family transcriptional regulator [Chryseobacterium sp. MYb7]PRB01677.1 Crp/Fnr family transcriptional regulator [Chryseobacterium sp. MYb7]
MHIPDLHSFLKTVLHLSSEVIYPAKTILLEEGKVSDKMFLVKNGALRVFFYQDGKELTLDFITENQAVSSFDSFLNGIPSDFVIETLESTTVYELHNDTFHKLMENQEFQHTFHPLFYKRFSEINKRLISFIKDSPQQRYEQLIKNRPELLLRFPQHYIASYLGITSVSLSRIRNRR